MLFSSITFLYGFLPLTLALYFLAPKSWRNGVLLAASLLFYFFGEPIYVSLLLISSINDFCWSLLIEKHRDQPKRTRFYLIASIVINLGLLGFFKYTDFFIGTVNDLLGTSIPLTGVPLPIGISFFTFQTMSYTIDVYRGRASAQRNPATFATFVCLFPQLIAGPIVRYTDVAAELESRKSTLEGVALGLRHFAFGLGKKVLLANAIGELCTAFRDAQSQSVLFFWLYAVAFSLQIYFDFSGYSDMAIGLGRIFGFQFPENFNYPFISKSITEFWRRWHMTLGSWFRDYVYIPLGGNRCSKGRWIFNLFIVWLATGIWHGASWNYVIWGLYFFVLLLVEKLWLGRLLEKLPRVIQHIYTLFFVLVSWAIFALENFEQLGAYLKVMFGMGGVPLTDGTFGYYLTSYLPILCVAALASTNLGRLIYGKLNVRAAQAVCTVLVIAGLVVCTGYLVDGTYNPFLYFRF